MTAFRFFVLVLLLVVTQSPLRAQVSEIPVPNEQLPGAETPAALPPVTVVPVAPPAPTLQAPSQPLMGSEASPIPLPLPESTAQPAFGGADGVLRMVVIGDTLAKGMVAGMVRNVERDPRFDVESRVSEASGLARPEVYDWPEALPKIIAASSFDAVVVLIGVNDRQTIRLDGVALEFGTPEWIAAYQLQINKLLATITAANLKVYWVNLPPMGEAKFDADMKMIAGLQRAAVDKVKGVLIDLTPALSNADGSYRASVIDQAGTEKRIRTRDGIGFLRQGNSVFGDLVLAAIRNKEGIKNPVFDPGAAQPVPAPKTLANQEPIPTSPVFGQIGSNGEAQSYEATEIQKEVIAMAERPKNLAGLDAIHPARNSNAEKLYRTGLNAAAPKGRFDDYSVPQVPNQP